MACALACALTLPVAAERPGDVGPRAYGETGPAPTPACGSGGGAVGPAFAALGDASRSRVFWMPFGTFFVRGLSTNGLVQTHFIPLCFDFGRRDVEAASVLAMGKRSLRPASLA